MKSLKKLLWPDKERAVFYFIGEVREDRPALDAVSDLIEQGYDIVEVQEVHGYRFVVLEK